MLPALREELALFPGPHAQDGSPTWSLHDPVRNLFFRIDWLSFELLSRWHLDSPHAILDVVRRDTTLNPEADDFVLVVEFLAANELLQTHSQQGTELFLAKRAKQRQGIATWLLHHYLFFRVPLLRPDAWLERTLPWVRPFFTRTFLMLTLLALALGLFEASRQWDSYLATLIDTFSWQGLATFGLTLVFVKFMHELGHAFTAKRFGCRVPAMGLAFLVMFPVAYTDVNEVWKLADRKQRLAVGAAGMLTELAIAAWSTLAWSLLPDGYLKSAAFLLATTTWITTLLINASPFLRFDGYFLLSDWLDMANLHSRSFALGRWQLREWLFGLREVPPEHIPRHRHQGLVLFAYCVWLYRLVIFSGIALLVYKFFPKPLGPFLAAVEVGWFILLPIMSEVSAWKQRLSQISRSPRSKKTLLLVIGFISLLFLPLDYRIQTQGMLKPVQSYPVVAAGAARIVTLPLTDGQAVREGEVLLRLETQEISFQTQQAHQKSATLRWQIEAGGVDEELRKRQPVLAEELGKAQAELQGLHEEQDRYAPTAPFTGRFFLSNPDIRPGMWVRKNDRLGTVADTRRWQVEAYLSERDLKRVRTGDRATFYSETPGLITLEAKVIQVDTDATRILPTPMLAVTHGGTLPVHERNHLLAPENAVYRVTLELTEPYQPGAARELRGRLVISGRMKSIMEDFLNAILALWVREAGF